MAIVHDLSIDPASFSHAPKETMIAAVHQLLAKHPNMKDSFKSIFAEVQKNPPSAPKPQSK